jgi:hypothetical protein
MVPGIFGDPTLLGKHGPSPFIMRLYALAKSLSNLSPHR